MVKSSLVKYLFRITKIVSLIGFLLFANILNAQVKKVETIAYNGQSLRELSERYFGDPNYWEVILQYNDLENATELHEGMLIKIPSGLVSTTLKQIITAKEKIGNAKEEGAKVLTPELITRAEDDFNKVIELKHEGDWENAYDTLQEVIKTATESLEQVKLLRASSADATISFTKGDVQRRKPKEKLWSEAELFAKLYEADRARTLAESFAEITFIDLSRIRLNENSQALIQHSRVDILNNKTETKVKLIKGDAFAYLLKSPKKKFDIDVPGLDAKIMSRSFWIEKEPVSTKIANFEGEIELTAQDSLVVVKENQGSIIPTGGVPSKPQDLLAPPALLTPQNLSRFFEDEILFTWSPIDEVSKYWFELASDASFINLITSNRNIFKTEFKVENIEPGVYYWHVASIDEQGFPGDFSRYNYLMVIKDEILPFLVVTSPVQHAVTKENSIIIAGETEAGLSVRVNNKPIVVESNGKFNETLTLENSVNNFRITTSDESGNESIIVRTVFYESSDQVENKFINANFKNERFITKNNNLLIEGITRPLARVKFIFGSIEKTIFADTTGNYIITLNLSAADKTISQIITTPSGYSLNKSYNVEIDKISPQLNITSVIPKITSEKDFQIKGTVTSDDNLYINSEEVKIENNNFQQNIELIEGENIVSITAVDVAGNKTEKELKIIRDTNPPELVKYEIETMNRNNGVYLITVVASDISGLKKSALVELDIAGESKNVIILLSGEDHTYSKQIFLDQNSNNVTIRSITLEDNFGNAKKYNIK